MISIRINERAYPLIMFNNAPGRLFVPGETGYTALPPDIAGLSKTGIAHHLNYRPSQLWEYVDDSNQSGILGVVAEVFSLHVVYVWADLSIENLPEEDVRAYLKNYDEAANNCPWNLEFLFDRGIKERSFSIPFLARNLQIEQPGGDGMFYIKKLDVDMYFIDGILVDYQFAAALNEWARFMREERPEMFRGYDREATFYWKNDMVRVIHEINRQADVFADLNPPENEFEYLHKTRFGTVNFVMLQVCHYGADIDFEDFVIINYGRYKELQADHYQVGNFVYRFTPLGKLAAFYRKS